MPYGARVAEYEACAAREEKAAMSAASEHTAKVHRALAEMYRNAAAKAASVHSAFNLAFGAQRIANELTHERHGLQD